MPPSTHPRLTEHAPSGARRATVLLLHGAGTDTSVPVLVTLADALAAAGLLAVRVDQPYTLAGRRPPAPAAQLDAVVTAVAAAYPRPLLLAGRSSGGRVACRIASSVGAAGVVALGFPLVPPRRQRTEGRPPLSRAPELAAAGVPVLVVQGTRDGFGTPEDVSALALPHVAVHAVAGGHHALGRPATAVAEALRVGVAWLVARARARES